MVGRAIVDMDRGRGRGKGWGGYGCGGEGGEGGSGWGAGCSNEAEHAVIQTKISVLRTLRPGGRYDATVQFCRE